LRLLSLDLAFLIWAVVNIAGVWFAARVFGGSASIALLSYPMLYSVFYGQITGVIVAGLALLWWGLHRHKAWVAGIGILLAAIKWQMGVPLIIALWIMAEVSWRERLHAVIVPLVVGLASLVVYPLWIIDVLRRLSEQPPVTFGSISLWQYFGALSLLLWLPPLSLPLPKGRRLVAVAAAGALAIPYYQHTGLIALFVLPVGWLGLLGNLGYLYVVLGEIGFAALSVVGLIAYGWALYNRHRVTEASYSASPGRG
jgi:hypothetical protein